MESFSLYVVDYRCIGLENVGASKNVTLFFSFLFFVERISTGLREYVCEYFFSVVCFNYIASVCVRTPKIKRVHAYALYTIVVDVFVRDWLSQNWISLRKAWVYTCLIFSDSMFDISYFTYLVLSVWLVCPSLLLCTFRNNRQHFFSSRSF